MTPITLDVETNGFFEKMILPKIQFLRKNEATKYSDLRSVKEVAIFTEICESGIKYWK